MLALGSEGDIYCLQTCTPVGWNNIKFKNKGSAWQCYRPDGIWQGIISKVSRFVRGFGIAGISHPQAGANFGHETHKAIALFGMPVAPAPHTGPWFTPLRLIRAGIGQRNQVWNQVSGNKEIDFMAQFMRNVIQPNDLHPAALVLQGANNLDKIAISGGD